MAKATYCLSNLRQLGIAVNLYATQNHQLMPVLSERQPLSAASFGIAANLAGSGRGRAWAGLLRDICRVPTNLFHCPADTREYDPSLTGFLVAFTTDGTVNGFSVLDNPDYMFSYTAIYAGYNHTPHRRMPWSISDIQAPLPGGYDRVRGGISMGSLAHSSEMLLLMDGYTTILSDSSGWAPTPTTGLHQTIYNSLHVPGASLNVRLNLYRHNPKHQDFEHGPNALFADGHAEMTINLWNLTDDNFSYPAN